MDEEREKNRRCSIRVMEDTLKEFNRQKRKRSADAYLSLMLNYFEVTEINPEQTDVRLLSVFNKGIERIIKIQKAQEKDLLRPIKNDLSDVLREKKSSQSIKDFSYEIGLDRELTKEDFLELGHKVSQTEHEKLELLEKIDILQNQISALKERTEYEDRSVILGCCQKIHEYIQSRQYDRISIYVDRIISVFQK